MKVLEDIKKYCLSRYNLSVPGAQVGIYALLVSIWLLVIMLLEHGVNVAKESMCVNAFVLFLLLVIFTANLYVLVPHLFKAKNKIRRWTFWVINLLLIVLQNHHIFNIYNTDLPSAPIQIGFYQFDVIWMILSYAVVAAVIFMRYCIRHSTLRRQLREEKQKMTEIELIWLKSQLNPHFLFNTLSNIALLTQVNPNNAQKAIGQLSEFLRYTLYEAQPKEVSLNGEITFIKDYISLMILRSGNNVEIESQFIIHDAQLLTAPLVFLMPIENTFKHSISANKPSFIHISITEGNGEVVFLCRNSSHPESDTDESRKDIGLENMYRRLELICPDRYHIEQRITPEVYHLRIIIKS